MDLKTIWNKILYREDENKSSEEIIDEEARSEERINFFKNIINGNWLTWDFMRSQRILFAMLAIMFIAWTDNRYRCEGERSRLSKLQKEVVQKRYEDLETSAKLVEMSRQSHVIESLQKYNSKLKESDTPAIKIE